VSCSCSGDDMDCYSVAQQELLHVISNATGCVVVLTGDFHFSDIKALYPGDTHPLTGIPLQYAHLYDSSNNSQPVYQVMASGMSYSTGK
jgi:alkaline phosphatase D